MVRRKLIALGYPTPFPENGTGFFYVCHVLNSYNRSWFLWGRIYNDDMIVMLQISKALEIWLYGLKIKR